MASKPELVVVDKFTDRDGRTVLVGHQGGDVRIAVTSNALTCAVDLGEAGQEQFAQAYVAACHQAKANAEAHGQVSG